MQHGPAASSGSNPKAPGSAGGYLLISDRQLRKTIDDLRELEGKCFASRSRFAFYDYLAAVFEFYVQLRRRNEAKPSARRIAKLFGLRKQNGTPLWMTHGVEQHTRSIQI
jgi:hypothetical protein